MGERAYTVSEINDLRQVVETKWLWGSYNLSQHSGGMSRSFNENERAKAVEEMVRTHMLAGHTAADLLASERRKP